MSLTVSGILELTSGVSGRLANQNEMEGRDSQIRIEAPSVLSGSEPRHICFFFNKNYQAELPHARPGVLITGEAFVEPLRQAALPLWKSTAVIACADPYLAMALVSEKLAAELSSVGPAREPSGGAAPQVHPSAIVHPSATLGSGVLIGPHCVIEEKAVIGRGTRIDAGCVIGPGVEIGENGRLFPRVTIYEWVRIGARVRLHSGTVIGSDGFGYAPVVKEGNPLDHRKIYHLGRVIIGDDVEIGANSCVDRGTMGDTIIESKAKLDNQVHVGHNARIEEGAALCGGICLAGRAVIGRFAYVGGLSGVVNNVRVGDGAKVAAMTLVSKDTAPGSVVAGNPMRDHQDHFQAQAALSRLLKERKRKKT